MKRSLKNWLFQSNQVKFVQAFFLLIVGDFNGQIANYVTNGGFEKHKLNTPVGYNPAVGWWAIDTVKFSYFLYSTLPTIGNAPYSTYGFQYPRTDHNMIITDFYCKTCGTPRG